MSRPKQTDVTWHSVIIGRNITMYAQHNPSGTVSDEFTDFNSIRLREKVWESLMIKMGNKQFDVWVEGYAATGQSAPATFHGKHWAETFDEACIYALGELLDKDDKEKDGYRRRDGRLCVWACRCFDNEIDARKSFG